MQLHSLINYPAAKLLNLSADDFAIMFSAALSHLGTQKDLLSREKNHDMILHYRRQINKIETCLATLRMHKHYQVYQNQISVLNTRSAKAA